jgi:hypothetical protein
MEFFGIADFFEFPLFLNGLRPLDDDMYLVMLDDWVEAADFILLWDAVESPFIGVSMEGFAKKSCIVFFLLAGAGFDLMVVSFAACFFTASPR